MTCLKYFITNIRGDGGGFFFLTITVTRNSGGFYRLFSVIFVFSFISPTRVPYTIDVKTAKSFCYFNICNIYIFTITGFKYKLNFTESFRQHTRFKFLDLYGKTAFLITVNITIIIEINKQITVSSVFFFFFKKL